MVGFGLSVATASTAEAVSPEPGEQVLQDELHVKRFWQGRIRYRSRKMIDTRQLLESGALTDQQAEDLLASVEFDDWRGAHNRLQSLCPDESCREELAKCLPMLLSALVEAATPDASLVNFDRFVQSVDDRQELFQFLANNPRAVEILVKLFVGSQFLTEILLRNPNYLFELTQHKRLAEFKSRPQFVQECLAAAADKEKLIEKFDAIRRFQRWEWLRIGACDSFRLMDLKTVTVQLSLLADSIVQCCLSLLASDAGLSTEGFAVVAFGKLGGEELNYSSDIDLVFVAGDDASRFWSLGQRLIKTLIESTADGFFYRVDMRLRPWGRSGALVSSVDSYIDYLQKHGRHWEKQALLKARVIAGDTDIGTELLQRAEPVIFDLHRDEIRNSVREMKARIEDELKKKGRKWGEVKLGTGSIRDIEFVTQFLQLANGGENRLVRSINTLDGLVRLADFGLLQADEFRQLTSGYVFLRTIEHALQLMHHKQIHSLPENQRELAYLARRLDFPSTEHFLTYYERHCTAVRRIYDKYISDDPAELSEPESQPSDIASSHVSHMESSYVDTFTSEEIEGHSKLFSKLNDENVVEVEAELIDLKRCRVTIVGFDQTGDLSIMCGLLFVYGFDICGGNVFTEDRGDGKRSGVGIPSLGKSSSERSHDPAARRKFVNVFTVEHSLGHEFIPDVLPTVWSRYKEDLTSLLVAAQAGDHRDAQGKLAKRVAGALRSSPVGSDIRLAPVEIELDNETSSKYTVLQIRTEDTTGFLYEFTNALALAGINVLRMIVRSERKSVFDTLYVTDSHGHKITDETKQRQLRAAAVLIKHFTHLLPHSPNPESALLHFGEFLEQLFRKPDWIEELSKLEQSAVLDALARLLGVSDFLWEDFLRLQHENLFPVVSNIEALEQGRPRDVLEAELSAEIKAAADYDEQKSRLNDFKDREMFRADMRHILNYVDEFGRFSQELTTVAEIVVAAALEICDARLRSRYGRPLLENGSVCPLTVCALGKCGGHELGFASDIELMFIYQGSGRTDGSEVITNAEYFQKIVELFTQTIRARQEGIFQIDLRLRPYGQAGSLAVSLDAFQHYFSADGAAWPYERQALVKLRPIAGDIEFGNSIVQLRNELVYTGDAFDASAMRAMREKQLTQLVKAGTVNAKLGPGGLVDCEYLVQGLQITHGHRSPQLRATNTRQAMAALESAGVLSIRDHDLLSEAYKFQRGLIDALRMVRGHAKDLTVPGPESEAFTFLARRLGYGADLSGLQADIERYSESVLELGRMLDTAADS